MKIELAKWSFELKHELINICNNVDRSYLSDRIPYPYTEQCADWWLNMVLEHDGVDGVFRAIVVDGQIVGNISIEPQSDVYCKSGEIGYLLLTPFWGKGIMTEAVRQICQIAFAELDIIRISACAYAPNRASARVLEKNGFEYEGLRENVVFKNGNIYDLCLFGKLK